MPNPPPSLQHEEGGVERLLGRPRGVPVDGDRVGVREEGTPDRSTHPGAGEVVGLREEGHRPRRRDRDGERVDERQVVARDQHAAGGRDVLGAGDGRPPDHLGQGCDHAVADAVGAGAHRGSSAMTVPPRMRSTTGHTDIGQVVDRLVVVADRRVVDDAFGRDDLGLDGHRCLRLLERAGPRRSGVGRWGRVGPARGLAAAGGTATARPAPVAASAAPPERRRAGAGVVARPGRRGG